MIPALPLSALFGRLPHFWLEIVLAVAFSLGVATVAYATVTGLPTLGAAGPPPAVAHPVVARVVPPAPPPPMFEFGEPVRGKSINSPFGLRRMPWEKHGRLHEGVDIAAPAGMPVVAVADGVVTRAGRDGGYGRFVEVRHAEGLVSFYAHLGRIDPRAKPGVVVRGGARIGRIGSSGTSTGPHLHFEIRQGDRPLNPVAFIGRDFGEAQDLPLRTAARYSRRVRVAHVSSVPASKRPAADGPREIQKLDPPERPRATMAVAPQVAPASQATQAADSAGEQASETLPAVFTLPAAT